MNRVFVVGNITSDIYFDRFLMHGEKRSYLRLILMAERPRSVRGMRIVIWDKKAELYFPYLKKGSELAVIGQFESRKYKDQWIHKVVSESLLLLRNIDWERGESIRQQYNLPSPNGTTNDVFIVGEVLEGIQLEWFKPGTENGSGEFAFLRLRLKCDDYLNGLRVTVRGSLAELVYPYLQTGSKVAIDGFPGYLTHPSYFLVNTFGLMRLFFVHSGWTEYLHLTGCVQFAKSASIKSLC